MQSFTKVNTNFPPTVLRVTPTLFLREAILNNISRREENRWQQCEVAVTLGSMTHPHVSLLSHFTSCSFFFLIRNLNFGKEWSGRGEQTPKRLDFKVLFPLIIGENMSEFTAITQQKTIWYTSQLPGFVAAGVNEPGGLTGQVRTCRVREVAARSPGVILEGAVRSRVVERGGSRPRVLSFVSTLVTLHNQQVPPIRC